MNQDLEFKLQAWLDGELSPTEARSIGREIAGNAEAAALVAELQTIKSVLAGNETSVPVPETREFYWSKIAREIERGAASSRPAPAPRVAAWQKWLSPLAGIISLACIALMATKSFAPAAFDEISSTGEGMEAVTFHDQSAGMTVVWLADSEQPQAVAAPTKTADNADDSQVEME
jgi:anti-sigma factor RsiW